MPDAHAAPPPSGRPAGGYEQSDLTAKAIAIFGIVLALVVVVVLVVTAWMFDTLAERRARMDAPPSPLAGTRAGPPEPRLQVDPSRDLRTLRAEEDALLGGYGWVDEDAGLVRIPIERAMDLLVERGLSSARKPGRR